MVRLPCAQCLARAGEWCVTRNGKRSGFLHAARYYAWKDRNDRME